ncbi:MAG TPA: Holliday junction resolvase RuvX [Clostridia bacterium]|nr:Holliday junction resolvase RuvX [Clostridia bacterium]
MKLMGVDLGQKRIGIAISDDLGITAFGLTVIERKGDRQDCRRLRELAREYGVQGFVVGLPLNMDGSMSEGAKEALSFADKLEKYTGLPVVTKDERLTTKEALRFMLEADMSRKRRKEVVDKSSAALILEGYLLEKRERQGETEGS